MSTPIKRKLATILSADVAGYSRLMEADEGTLRAGSCLFHPALAGVRQLALRRLM